MARPTFDIAMIWDSNASATAAGQSIEDLIDLIPAGQATFAVTQCTGGATLHLKLDFSLYSRGTLGKLEAHAHRSGGKFVEFVNHVAPG